MLWRFSFASASTLDALLSRETPPSVEELLEEPELLQEVKAQNNKLLSYLSKEDSIKSLLTWVTSGLDELDQQATESHLALFEHAMASPSLYPSYHTQQALRVPGPGPNSPPLEPVQLESEGEEVKQTAVVETNGNSVPGSGVIHTDETDEDVQRAKYPASSTEVLTSELWTITETVMSNKEGLLRPFWEAVLPPLDPPTSTVDEIASNRPLQSERDRARDEFWSEEDEERDRKREMIRGMWVKVNGSFLSKRTTEMIRFIQTIPNFVERMMARINSPAIQDMLVRIVATEEAGVSGVIDWLAEQGLIPRLIALLSPQYPTSTHLIAADLLKSIITLCAPAPFNPQGGNAQQQAGQVQPAGTRDNRLTRELVSLTSIRTMVGFMLDPLELSDAEWKGSIPVADPFVIHPLPSISSATSSLAHVCNILVELIRRNNSDFSEPHLFHTLRNRILTAKQSIIDGGERIPDDEMRSRLEEAMLELSAKMGIVHLGSLLSVVSERFGELHHLLLNPRSITRSASKSNAHPLTFERFRIVELFAELLHSSNMSILNRTPGTGPMYTPDGILSGGLDGLEKLGNAIEGDQGNGDDEVHITQARELPVSSGSTDCSLTDDSDDDDASTTSIAAASDTTNEMPQPPAPSQADVARLRDVMDIEQKGVPGSDMGSVSHAAVAATTAAPSVTSEDNHSVSPDVKEEMAAGDVLKHMYIKHRVLPTVVDLFFDHPNNDFLHHVVYDLLQQILNGRLTPGLNRELVIEMIRDAKLVERILDAQRINDRLVQQPRTPRLAYMGHMILIAEELVKFLERSPEDLLHIVQQSFVRSEWEAFVQGSLRETKDKDARPLAGGKPMLSAVPAEPNKEESDEGSSDEEDSVKFGEPLSRTSAGDENRFKRGGFGYSGSDGGDDDEEAWGVGPSRSRQDSSDEDDDADWLRPTGSDDGFGSRPVEDLDDDDAWGTFNSAEPAENPFGDDSFVPPDAYADVIRSNPLTPNDWASAEFFENEFNASGPMETTWSAEDEDVPAIVVPSLEDDDNGLQTPTSTWSFSGEDEGEDLPPTISPTFEDTPVLGIEDPMAGMTFKPTVPQPKHRPAPPPPKLEPAISATPSLPQAGPSTQPASSPRPIPSSPHQSSSRTMSSSPKQPPSRSPSSPITIPPRPRSRSTSFSSSSPTSPIPNRSPSSPTSNMFHHPAASVHTTFGEAISPPDKTLIAAASVDEPLGPGVSGDTHVTSEGMLERIVDGEKIVVPQDEIVRGVEEAEKHGE